MNTVRSRNFSKVNDNLYRGSLPSEKDLEGLRDLGIRTVVDFNRQGHAREKLKCKELSIQYIHKPWEAGWHRAIFWKYYVNIAEEFLIYVRDESLFPIYIHCYHGRDRTGMLIALYRMVHEGWSYADALKEMRSFGFNPMLRFDLPLFLLRYRRRVSTHR